MLYVTVSIDFFFFNLFVYFQMWRQRTPAAQFLLQRIRLFSAQPQREWWIPNKTRLSLTHTHTGTEQTLMSADWPDCWLFLLVKISREALGLLADNPAKYLQEVLGSDLVCCSKSCIITTINISLFLIFRRSWTSRPLCFLQLVRNSAYVQAIKWSKDGVILKKIDN